jgi:hypothetical protein
MVPRPPRTAFPAPPPRIAVASADDFTPDFEPALDEPPRRRRKLSLAR